MEGNKNSFGWSLKPLEWIMRLTVGASIYFPNIKRSPISLSLVFLIGCFILLSNLLINGPRGINIQNFDWMKRIQNFENHFLYFKEYPDDILQFVMDVISICFFIVLPSIQIIFLLTRNYWSSFTRLITLLIKIKNEMKLSSQFYEKCRKRSIIALLTLILVRITKEYFLNVSLYILYVYRIP